MTIKVDESDAAASSRQIVYHNEEEDEESHDDVPLIHGQLEDGPFPKARHIFGMMGFLGFALVYAMRVNLSVTIVAMVNQSAIPHINVSVEDVCPEGPSSNSSNSEPPMRQGSFVWDEKTQGIVLGAFFYGYVLTQIPGGRLSEIFGGKLIYGYGVLITAIFTLLTPVAAHWNFSALVLVRILEGMGEGVTYPAMHAMLAHWIPPLERSKFAAVVYAGSNIGTVVSLMLAGWLCSLELMGGWPLAFYVFGILGIIWFVFWMCLVYDRPSTHPRIDWNEKTFIERSIWHKSSTSREELENQNDSIPWRHILTSVPVWAILITQCGNSWAFYTQLSELPTYMHNILRFGIQSNAFLTSVPYLTSFIVGILCSICADWLLAKGYISLKNSYKFWNTISTVVPSLGLIGVAWVGCDWVWAMIMLAGVGSFTGACYAGNQMNHIALSPRYAGTMYGLTNSISNFCGFLAPYAIGLIINGHETLDRWRLVFYLAGGVNIAANFFYMFFANADEQPWSKNRRRRVRDE